MSKGTKNILIGFTNCGKETNGSIVYQKDIRPMTVVLGSNMTAFDPVIVEQGQVNLKEI